MYHFPDSHYKDHFVCIDCRKTFKRRQSKDLYPGKENREEKPFRCPECAGPVLHVSKSFVVPKKSDTKRWELMKHLVEAGMHVYGTGGQEPPTAPPNKKVLIEFLEAYVPMYIDNYRSTTAYVPKTEEDKEKNEQSKAHWKNRIELLQNKLAELKAKP